MKQEFYVAIFLARQGELTRFAKPREFGMGIADLAECCVIKSLRQGFLFDSFIESANGFHQSSLTFYFFNHSLPVLFHAGLVKEVDGKHRDTDHHTGHDEDQDSQPLPASHMLDGTGRDERQRQDKRNHPQRAISQQIGFHSEPAMEGHFVQRDNIGGGDAGIVHAANGQPHNQGSESFYTGLPGGFSCLHVEENPESRRCCYESDQG